MPSKGVKMASGAKSAKIPQKALFDESSSSSSEDDQDDGGATLDPSTSLKINEEFAKKFEHNKKREELHRLQEKYKGDANGEEDDESSSEDESEDDDGLLVTEDLDAEISATLAAIKNKDPRIYDKEAVFYKPFGAEGGETDEPKEKKEKPVFLRDYHRERYLAGDVGTDQEMEDANKPRTYVQEQADLKKTIVSEINAAAVADDEEWSDDDAFLKPVEKKAEKPAEKGIHPSRQAAIKLTEVDVKNAEKEPEEFLSKFMASKAWAPPDGSKWEAFESDDGEDDDDMADQFEHAYNIRFEDPSKSNEILKTYSRNMAASKSVRKEELTGRKKLRALEKERKEAEKKQREEERARLRRLKVGEAADKLAKIKRVAGLTGKKFKEDEWIKFLDDAWDDDEWEAEMAKRFGEDYYADKDGEMSADDDSAEEGESKKKQPKKPKFDDDIDIKDIIPDFDDEEIPPASLIEEEEAEEEAEAEAQEAASESGSESDRPSKKRKTTKDIKNERIAAKRQARAELTKIEALVEAKMEIDNPRVLASSSKDYPSAKPTSGGFRYRETSPQSFGMTARDILLAPSDAALNEFAGLKKLATFRDAEKKRKDKKLLGKKARLRQWRREQFGTEFEHTGPTFGFEAIAQAEQDEAEDKKKRKRRGDASTGANTVSAAPGVSTKTDKKKVVKDGIVEGERKKRKRSKGKGKKADEVAAKA
ncbi:KRI1-like family-domain-containing protein [Lasiosphaeria hispida]|uniref:KRI1-like family-domain-containing protein n=1 Tax=Lasiosphaeria hispida TaxID=260671 RepID=A0AAJ0HLL1_9PEZI|nr:KRI1-like family-domain-containing protein [Lasiosphaeria hispida]